MILLAIRIRTGRNVVQIVIAVIEHESHTILFCSRWITKQNPPGRCTARLRQNDACGSTVGNGLVEGEADGCRHAQPQPS